MPDPTATATPAEERVPRFTYLEPQAQESHDWTPARMRAAWDQAEQGDLMEAADLWKRVLLDDRVKSGFEKRVQNLLKRNLSFEASGDRRRSRRVVKTLEADDDFDVIAPDDVLAQLLRWGLGLGVALAEKVWVRSEEHDDRDLPTLKVWNPRWLRYDKARRVWMVQVEGEPPVEILKDDPKWFLFFPYGEHEPWAQGLWWPLAFWWLAKQLSVNDWAAFSKAAGSPIPIGYAPEQSKPETRDNWRKQLEENLRRGRAAVLPPGYDIKYLLADGKAYETYKEKIDLGNRSIDITILGGNLSTEVDGGSLAASEVHERTEQGKAEADGKGLAGQLRNKVLTWWALFNFGLRQLAPWPFWDTEPPEDLKKKGDGLSAIGQGLEKVSAALAPLGLEIDPDSVKQLLAKSGLSFRAKPPPPAPPAPPPGPSPAPPAAPAAPAPAAPPAPSPTPPS